MPDEPLPGDEDENLSEGELEQRIQEMGLDKPISVDLPEVPTAEEIQKKLSSAKSTLNDRFPEAPELKFQRPKMLREENDDKTNYRGLGFGLTIAYALVGCMLAGFGIGWLIDRATGGGVSGQAFGGLIGCIVGIGFTFYLLNRQDSGK